MTLSIIVPCHNESRNVRRLYDGIRALLGGLPPVELIFVDDGSSDGTCREARDIIKGSSGMTVRLIRLAGSFGKEAAMLAGMQAATGDLLCVMDADLQDPPGMLPVLASAASSGTCDVAIARRSSRNGDPVIRSFLARIFYRAMRTISGLDIRDGERDFRVMTRAAAEAMLSCPERSRFFKGLSAVSGFRRAWFEYAGEPRSCGRSAWSFSRLCGYAADAFFSFSRRPLVLIAALCCLSGIAAAAFGIASIRASASGSDLGCLAVMCAVSTACFFNLISALTVGIYAAKSYEESRRRPHFALAPDNDERSDEP